MKIAIGPRNHVRSLRLPLALLLAACVSFTFTGCKPPKPSASSGSKSSKMGDGEKKASSADKGSASSSARPSKNDQEPAASDPDKNNKGPRPGDMTQEATAKVGAGNDTPDKGDDRQTSVGTVGPNENNEAPNGTFPMMLGSKELTAGIPGEGPLTVEQVSAWLGQPENHLTLAIQLPLGVRAGQPVGLQENPLTIAKIELGRQLYFDRRLSADGTVSCADCHHPQEGFGRHTQFGVGVNKQEGGRNSPVSYNRLFSGAQFWDGRAASLEEQAKGPIANPIEMGHTHENAVATVKGLEAYRLQFEAIFKDEGLTIDTIAKAIASFERAIITLPSPADHHEFVRAIRQQFPEDSDLDDLKAEEPERYKEYVAAVEGSKSMSESAKRGRELFFGNKAGCTACHSGANFTDEKYHNLGVGMEKDEPDVGRMAVTKDEKDRGAFKTPTVRNVTLSAPYMHDGSQKTLEEVVNWYDRGGHPNANLSDKIKKLGLSDQDKADLVEYMKALEGGFPAVETGRLP